MEALVDAGVDGATGTEAGEVGGSSFAPITDPVVYQLVRVEGDGRLVPATNDEVIEVEQLLEDDKDEMASIEGPCHNGGCVSNEVLSSKKSGLEGSEGLSQSENSEINSQKLNARLEYIEVMLQKVKHEERLRLSRDSHRNLLNYIDVDGQPSDHPNNSLVCIEKLQSDITSLATSPHPTSVSGGHGARSEVVATCSKPATEPSVSGLSESLKPDFSTSKGEICFSNLTVSELQQVYRATFGCETSVKDKLWLKRRIATGLSNCYDLPTTNFDIPEEKVVHTKVKEESLCRVRRSEFKASLSSDKVDGSRNDVSLESSMCPTKQQKDMLVLSGKRLRSVEEYDAKSESLHMEQIAAKRVRKPTKRYIEELSDVETRDCTGTLSDSVKNSGHGHSSPISRMRSVCHVGSQGTTFVTRQDSLGGSHIQIPYVSRVRRGRPRKNFMALMNIVGGDREGSVMEIPHSEEEHDLEHRRIDSYGDVSDENADAVPTLKYGARRKHHRAWTLCEVMKLVEGVARFGTGRWSEIKRLAFTSHAYRTSVDLKDKWRNLLRASFAQGPMEKGARKHAPMPVPTSILSRVKELAEMHSQPAIEFGPARVAGLSRRTVGEKGSGFL